MANVPPAELLTRADTALQEAGYRRSAFVWSLFARDTASFAHKAFAVGLGGSEFENFDGRDDYADAGEAVTMLIVRTAHKLRGEAQFGDLGDALTHELLVFQELNDRIDRQYIRVEPADVSRTVSQDGAWLLSEGRFRVYHRISFAVP